MGTPYYDKEVVDKVKDQYYQEVKKNPENPPRYIYISSHEYKEVLNARRAGVHVNVPVRAVNMR